MHTTGRKWDYLLLDTRSVAVFRILLGISILYNFVFIKWPYVREFYDAQKGLFTQAEWRILNGIHSPSVFDWVRSENLAYFILSVAIAISVAFILGFRTRYTSVILLVLYYNIQAAVSGFCFGYDFYTFQLLFWAIFLPLSNYFSWDARRNRTSEKYLSALPVSIAILTQVAVVYCTTGLVKAGPSWWGGYALRTMSLDIFSTHGIAPFLRSTPLIYVPLTYLTLIFEILFPLLLFVRYQWVYLRIIAAVILLIFHLSVFLSYDVANFSITGIAVAFLLIPGNVWDKYLPQLSNDTLKPGLLQGKLKSFTAAVIGIVCFIMVHQGMVFAIGELARYRKGVFVSLNEITQHLEIQNPFKFSFFLQKWKMFAPNPPPNCGWIALEEKREDGFIYDLISGALVHPDKYEMHQKYKGFEKQLLNPARSYRYRESWKYRMFLQKWIPYQIQKKYPGRTDFSNIIFAEYDFFISKDNSHQTPAIKKQMYPIKAVMGMPVFVTEQDTAQTVSQQEYPDVSDGSL